MFKYLKTTALAIMLASFPAIAQTSQEPIITFRTTLYDSHGTGNAFHFVIGSTETTYIDVDCGYGPTEEIVEMAIPDSDGSIKGTTITGSVSKDGVVKIYGDASKIDYLNLEGVYIKELDLSKLTNLEILYLNHNELQSLDLTPLNKLTVLELEDNPFDKSALIVGGPKPELVLLNLTSVGNLDPSFSLRDYPKLISFDAYHCPSLKTCDPTGCPELVRLCLDITDVETLDVSKNSKLAILNIAQSKIVNIDLSHNPVLQEFYCNHYGSYNEEYKLSSIDVSNNPELIRLFCNGNLLTDLDVSKNPKLINLNCSNNLLKGIDISSNTNLLTLDISNNYMDFTTMPGNSINWIEYYFYQHPFEVKRSYPVGETIDFSARVNRPESTTYARLMVPDNDNPGVYKELGDDFFKFEEGKLTLLKSHADSIYVSFGNTALPDYDLTTARFKVKELVDYGKDNPAVRLRLSPLASDVAFSVGILGASESNPLKFSVDFGDGNPMEFTTTSANIPTAPNATGKKLGIGNVVIYIPEGSDITALAMNGTPLSFINLDDAPTLQYLTLNNCQLSAVTLPWNRCLKTLDLSDNNIAVLDLGGADGDNGKNVLTDIRAPRNKLTSVTLSDGRTPLYVDFSDNLLTEFNLDNATRMITLNLANNKIENLDLEDCEALENLDISGNLLGSLPIPTYTPLKNVNLSRNLIPLPALPATDAFEVYTYAPQQAFSMPEKAPTINLNEHWLDRDGKTTVFEWRRVEDGRILTDSEVSGTEGHYRFLDPSVGEVYCSWSHPDFPDFKGENLYRTTNIVTAEIPKHVVASFKTLTDGTASLILTGAKANTTVYVDWSGKLDLEQCVLGTSYKAFSGKSHAGAEAKVYSYDDNDGVTVFNLSAGPLEYIDASAMKGLTAFSCSGSELPVEKITMPQSPALKELSINGAKISNFDFSQYKSLQTLNLSENELESLDLSKYPELQCFYASSNKLTSVKFNNPKLWELVLSANELEEVSLEGLPSLMQLFLSNNKLSKIDLDNFARLNAIYIDGNNFTLATLPPTRNQWTVYHYGSQKPIQISVENGKVDLSAQASVGNSETTYRWFIDSPYYDEENNLVGEELYEGTEYKIENGVTTFLKDFHNIMCVMTNEVFPELVLYTNFINVTGISGVNDIASESSNVRITTGYGSVSVHAGADTAVAIYSIEGSKIAEGVTDTEGTAFFKEIASGIYIVKAGETTVKVIVK